MTFLKDGAVLIPELGFLFSHFLPVTDSHMQEMLEMVYASLVTLFNYHSLKVLYPRAKMDGYYYSQGCAVMQ